MPGLALFLVPVFKHADHVTYMWPVTTNLPYTVEILEMTQNYLQHADVEPYQNLSGQKYGNKSHTHTHTQNISLAQWGPHTFSSQQVITTQALGQVIFLSLVPTTLKYLANTTRAESSAKHIINIPATFSAGFVLPPVNKRFWGLRSMWAIPFTWRNWSARAVESLLT